MASLTPEALAALGRDSTGSKIDGHNQPAPQPSANEELYQFHNYEGSHPQKIADIYQLTLGELCGMISERFRCIFKHYQGCTYRISANGLIEFVMVFSPGINNPQTGNMPLFDNIRNLVDKRKPSTAPKNSNAEFAEIHFDQNRKAGRQTMTLNDKTKQLMKRFMTYKLDANKKPVLNWNDCIEEIEFNSQIQYARRDSVLILSNIDLNKIVDSIMIPAKYIFEDEARAIVAYMSKYSIPKTDENIALYSTTSKFYEIYGSLNIIPTYSTSIVYKGYRYEDGYGGIMFSPNPANASGLPILDLNKYYVNLTVTNYDVIRATLPNQIRFQNTGSLVLY